MIVISHRINSSEALRKTPQQYGVELDLRDYDGKVVVQHDPWKTGESFEEYLESYRHRFLILNVKCEGIEERVLHAVRKRGIEDYFLLDLSFPALVKVMRTGERRIAVRWSEHEPPEAALALAGKIDWVWVDCFTDYPELTPAGQRLLEHFRTCLVAPELQGRPPLGAEQARIVAKRYGAAAVCTKTPETWAATVNGER